MHPYALTMLVYAWKYMNVLQETPNPDTNISASCSRQVGVLCDDVALNACALKWRFNWPRPLVIRKKDDGENGIVNVEHWEAHRFSAILMRWDTSNSQAKRIFNPPKPWKKCGMVWWTITRRLGCHSYQPCTLMFYRSIHTHTRGIFYLPTLA